MKKHLLLVIGLFFLSVNSEAITPDSTLKVKAIQKMEQFVKLFEYLASPAFDLTTKAEIERTLQTEFLENQDVRLYQDLNFQFGHAQNIAALQYFNQLRVLYPNGAQLKSGEFEVSDIFYDEARDMYYLKIRCSRMFKGLNVMAKKEVKVNKMIDYQVKIMEAGAIKIEIVGNFLADGVVNLPLGMDKTLEEIKKTSIAAKADFKSENEAIAKNSNLLQSLRLKGEACESLLDEKKSPNKF